MIKYNHLFKVGQKVKCKFDQGLLDGTIKEIYEDHIIVDVPMVCSHCWYEENFNLDTIFPDYNF